LETSYEIKSTLTVSETVKREIEDHNHIRKTTISALTVDVMSSTASMASMANSNRYSVSEMEKDIGTTIIADTNHVSTNVGFFVHTVTLSETTSTPYTGSGTDSIRQLSKTYASAKDGAHSSVEDVTRETSIKILSVEVGSTDEPRSNDAKSTSTVMYTSSSESIGHESSTAARSTPSTSSLRTDVSYSKTIPSISSSSHISSSTAQTLRDSIQNEFETRVVSETSTTVNGFHVHTITLTEKSKAPYTGSGTRSFESTSFSSRTSGSEEGWITETTLPLYSVELSSSESASTDISSSATHDYATSSLQSTSGLTRKSIKRQSATTLLEIHSVELSSSIVPRESFSTSQVVSSTSYLPSQTELSSSQLHTSSSDSPHSGTSIYFPYS
jgi:hypothetical protein